MPYDAVATFWLEATPDVQLTLRRYVSGSTEPGHYHDASVAVGRAQAVFDERGFLVASTWESTRRDDPRWPVECAAGDGYVFEAADVWQENPHVLYRRVDTGEEMTLRDAPAGACWDAFWMPDPWRGPDGVALMVRLPNLHDWHVDSEASNCTRMGEPHECWVRHGDPRECKVTVDKDGDTCAAGAGSILAGDYHGFLQGGVLTAG